MSSYLICRCCRYATRSTSNMKQHFRSRKHKENKRTYVGGDLTDDEKNNIVKENTERRTYGGTVPLGAFIEEN